MKKLYTGNLRELITMNSIQILVVEALFIIFLCVPKVGGYISAFLMVICFSIWLNSLLISALTRIFYMFSEAVGKDMKEVYSLLDRLVDIVEDVKFEKDKGGE